MNCTAKVPEALGGNFFSVNADELWISDASSAVALFYALLMCSALTMNGKQSCKVFVGGLSWETNNEKLRAYFENFGVVREAFISVNRTNGRPRGFGFVTFESEEVAKKVIATKHTIDRREVEAKESFAKEEQSSTSQASSEGHCNKNRKLFVGGLAPAVDDTVLREHFEAFGPVESAEVMLDHDSKRTRGFGFVTFASEESAEKVFEKGTMHMILEKQVEVKLAMPRDQMPVGILGPQVGRGGHAAGGRGLMQRNGGGFPGQMPYGPFSAGGPAAGYGPRSAHAGLPSMPPRGQPGYRGPAVGPGFGNQRGGRGGYGNIGGREGENFGNLGSLPGFEMYHAAAALYQLNNQIAAGGLPPQQLSDFQGSQGSMPLGMNAQALKQLESSLASLNVGNQQPATSRAPSGDPALDPAQALDFYKPSMGPGWSS